MEVPGRVYKEYRLGDYHPWLRERVRDPQYWNSIRSCILSSKTCIKIETWTTLDYFQRDMTSVQVPSFFFLFIFICICVYVYILMHPQYLKGFFIKKKQKKKLI